MRRDGAGLRPVEIMPQITRLHILIVLSIVGGFLVLAAWGISAPVGSSPDDGKHLPSIWCAYGEQANICAYEGPNHTNLGQATVPEGLGWPHGCWSWKPEQSAACIGFRDMPLTEQTRVSADISFLQQTPGLFYKTMYWLTDNNLEQSILRIRLANILLALAMVTLAGIVATGATRTGLILAWLVTPIPLGLSIIPSTNPSAWAIIGIGTYWAFLLAHWQAKTRGRRIAAGVGAIIAAVLAIGGRTDSAAYVVLVTAAVAVLYWGPRWREARRAVPLLVIPLAAVIAAVLVFRRSPQSAVASNGMGNSGQDSGYSSFGLLARNISELPGFWLGSFGKWPIGTLDIALPDWVLFSAGIGFFALVFIGIRQLDWPKTAGLLIAFAGISVLPLWIYQRGSLVVGQELQPRYFLPLFFVLLGLAVLSPQGRRLLVLQRAQQIVLVIALVGAATGALFAQMHRYTVGDGTFESTFSNPEWWSQGVVSPSVALILGFLGFTAWAIAAMLLLPRGVEGADAGGQPEVADLGVTSRNEA
jgi:hypothetical protein